ncbi:MAG: hypothetical protein V4549_06415 [Bacteroidota bacterium]
MASPINCDFKDLTPEDFIRRFVRTDGNGNYALAIKDVTSDGVWTDAITCTTNKDLTWQDIIALIATNTDDGGVGINAVIE